MSKFTLPTETIELPSKGLLYPKDSELAKGIIEMKYMTAKEEDILTNQSYIQKGTVIDKLIKSLIVSKIDFNQLLIGDKNAIMVAARILGYGGKYEFTYKGEHNEIDLSTLDNKKLDKKLFEPGINEFSLKLPQSGNEITFKLLTHKDEQDIARELEGLKKINKDSSPELTTRLKHVIQSVNGERDKKDIRDYVDNYLLARDSRSLREYIKKIQPDIDLTFFPKRGGDAVNLPIGLSFFWPDAG